QRPGEAEHLLLDAAGDADAVRADEADPHAPASRSLGQFGWSRCHCSGASRISSPSASARSWDTRATSSRGLPFLVVSIGGRATPWWERPSTYTAAGTSGAPVRSAIVAG